MGANIGLQSRGQTHSKEEAFSDLAVDYLTWESNFYKVGAAGPWNQPGTHSVTCTSKDVEVGEKPGHLKSLLNSWVRLWIFL